MMVSFVIVSHSRALARAAVALAEEMVPQERRPHVEIAAGLDEDTFGTDAEAIAAAISTALDDTVGPPGGPADGSDGVLVLLDLGSAILSAEMALEFLDEDVASRVRLSPAPLVEGLIAALVTASTGADLATVAADADNGLLAKRGHLGGSGGDFPAGDRSQPGQDEPEETDPPGKDTHADSGSAGSDPPGDSGERLTWSATLTTPLGLHARPAASLVQALRGVDADVRLADATNGRGPVPAANMLLLATLDARQNHELTATIAGPEAAAAWNVLQGWADGGFGDSTG